jgi:hypothetical protein
MRQLTLNHEDTKDTEVIYCFESDITLPFDGWGVALDIRHET